MSANDLDGNRADPTDLDDARAKYVLWSTKEFYVEADLKAEGTRLERERVLDPRPDCRYHSPDFFPFLDESKKERAQREADEANRQRAYRQRVDEWNLRDLTRVAEHKERRKPLEWLAAEALHFRVSMTHWVTAFELGKDAARIERIRTVLTTVMSEEM